MRSIESTLPNGEDETRAYEPTVYFTPIERLRAYLRIRNKRTRPRSHVRLKVSKYPTGRGVLVARYP